MWCSDCDSAVALEFAESTEACLTQLDPSIMEDAILDYIKMKYVGDESDGAGIDEGNGDMIRELKPTDQIIIVQQKGNNSEIHEIWYGNGLDYTVIDRERVDWIFSQDIQNVLVDRDQP